MQSTIIIRTYNEERHLGALLGYMEKLGRNDLDFEVIVVDSGSTDSTLEIAHRHKCRIVNISKSEFSFGRSLNLGCRESSGEFCVFLSGHCLPAGNNWLAELVGPLISGTVAYTYGKQIGVNTSKFSELQLLEKNYPDEDRIPQEGYFVNNANAAISRRIWEEYGFDEDLTGLEDMELGQRLAKDGHAIGYVASSVVYHMHNESWHGIMNRYEREAIALQRIMPEVHLSVWDVAKYYYSSVMHDTKEACRLGSPFTRIPEILAYRFMQFRGSYRGNHKHRKLSKEIKERYFYPK